MNKYVYLIVATFVFFNIYGQNGVGINTTSPTKTLHIKSEKDYIIKFEDNNTYNGNYTVTSSDSDGTFKIVKTDVFKPVKLITKSGIINTVSINNLTYGEWKVINSEIKLEPGRWAIHLTSILEFSNLANIITAEGNSIFDEPTIIVEATIADNTSINTTPPTLTPDIEGTISESINGNGIVRGSIVSPLSKGIIKGVIYINNTSTNTKTYRIMARSKAIGLSATSEPIFTQKFIQNLFNNTSDYNQIYAVPLN